MYYCSKFDEMKVYNKEIVFEGWKDVQTAIECLLYLALVALIVVFTVQIPKMVEIKRIKAEATARNPEAAKEEPKDDATLILVPNPALDGQPTPMLIP